jgi:hypothetical protein
MKEYDASTASASWQSRSGITSASSRSSTRPVTATTSSSGVELVQGEARQVTDQVVRGRGQRCAAGLDRGRAVLYPRGRAQHQREREPARPAADRRPSAGVVDTVVPEHLVRGLCVERRHPEPHDPAAARPGASRADSRWRR